MAKNQPLAALSSLLDSHLGDSQIRRSYDPAKSTLPCWHYFKPFSHTVDFRLISLFPIFINGND
jgi:hypothetical protein